MAWFSATFLFPFSLLTPLASWILGIVGTVGLTDLGHASMWDIVGLRVSSDGLMPFLLHYINL